MYISHKLEEVRKNLAALTKNASPEEKIFYDSLYDLVSTMAGEVDVLGSRVEELEEKAENYETYTEHLSASLQSLRDCIVGDVTVDTDAYTEDYDKHDHCGCGDDDCDDCGCCGDDDCDDDCDCEDDGCGCGCESCSGGCEGCSSREEEDDFEDFFSVQCPFCQEVFFVEKGEYEDNIECPLCNHLVAVMDNLLDM